MRFPGKGEEARRAMVAETGDIAGDLEQLHRRFEEFRSAQPGHKRCLPEALWTAAAELAKRYGVNPTARALRLEYGGLRKRVENQGRPKRKRAVAKPPNFMTVDCVRAFPAGFAENHLLKAIGVLAQIVQESRVCREILKMFVPRGGEVGELAGERADRYQVVGKGLPFGSGRIGRRLRIGMGPKTF